MDGPGLYWALRRRYGKSIPRIIFVTGQAHTPEYESFLAAMAEPVLGKPFAAVRLLQAVEAVLGT